MSLDVFNCTPDCCYLLCILVGNFNIELLFHGHNELYCVQGISTKIINKGGIYLHILRPDSKLINDNFFDSLFKLSFIPFA